jgi:DNA invertase Pin-like site-specific DNA recombinase
MKPTALYYRVSDDKQETASQKHEVERFVAARGLNVVAVYEEKVSGGARVRPAFDRMMLDARAGQFTTLVVWALDRFDRQGPARRLMLVEELDRIGVCLVSVKEPWAEGSPDNPARELLFCISGWLDKQERIRRAERTRAGLAATVAKGTKLGRPPTSFLKLSAAAKAIREGKSWREATKAAGVSQAALARWLADPRRAT